MKSSPARAIRITRLITAAWCAVAGSLAAAESPTVWRDLAPLHDPTRVLVNPHKGWYHHFPDNHPNKYQIAHDADLLDFPGIDHLYLRLAWAYLEPKEGQFDWAVIDRIIEKWTAQGLGIAFRISCKETSTDRLEQQFATPRWVRDAGARGGHFRMGKATGPDGPWEPEFDDPVFLAKLDRFLAAFAARYDAKPWLRYLDIGSIGDWGEGHCWAGSRKDLSFAVRKQHVELHLKHFRRTQLVISDDYVQALNDPAERSSLHQFILANGISYRDDSIMVDGYFAGTSDRFTVRSPELFDDAFRHTPTVFELEHYGQVKSLGNWDALPNSAAARFGKGKRGPDFFRGALELLHATYIGYHGDAREWLADNPELTRELLNRCGYWLFPQSLGLPEQLVAGTTVPVTLTLENRGVAPPYAPYELRLKLSGGNTNWVHLAGRADPSWLPGKPIVLPLELPLPAALEPGPYQLAIGLFDAAAAGERPVEFALEESARDSEGYYRMVMRSVSPFVLAASVPADPGLARSRQPPDVAALADEVRDQGWICFGARSPAGDWDLFACRPDGSALRNLTRTPLVSEFSPQFSRDGRRLLYRRGTRNERLDNNRHGEQGELVLANADASQPIVLGRRGELTWASFSPDGRQIASLSIQGIAFYDLERRAVVRRLPRQGFFQQVTWSPDGRWLVGVANAFGTGWSVARMDTATGEVGAVNRVDCCTPDWFPDSRDVIFSWRPPGQKVNNGYGWTQLWRASADGQSRQLVYGEDGRHVYGGCVSPDAKYVLFTGNMEEDGDPGRAGAPMALMRLRDAPVIGGESTSLRALHPKTVEAPVLTLPTGWEPCWTDVESLAPNSGPTTGTSSVMGVDATYHGAVPEAGAPRMVAPSIGNDATTARAQLAGELRTKGWLVFSAKVASGDWDLFVMRPDGSDRRPVTNTPQHHEAGARFSPDGRQLLYYRIPRAEPVDNNSYGTFELVLANADGGDPVVFGSGFPWASWGPEGGQIACLAPKGIRLVDVKTRSVIRELPRRGFVSQLVWSPDGRRLAGTANGLGPFWNIGCLELESGAIHAVSETERYNCTPDWTPDAQAIVYARGIIPEQPGQAELWVASTDGGKRRRLHAEPARHIYGACVSPDGRYLLFTRSREDLGQVPDIELAIIRWPREFGDSVGDPVRLDLGAGWEPHWTERNVIP